jgi:hypothetical protein
LFAKGLSSAFIKHIRISRAKVQSDTPKRRSRSHDAVIRVYDDAGNVIETHEPGGRFQGVVGLDSFTDCSVPLVVRPASIARETTPLAETVDKSPDEKCNLSYLANI